MINDDEMGGSKYRTCQKVIQGDLGIGHHSILFVKSLLISGKILGKLTNNSLEPALNISRSTPDYTSKVGLHHRTSGVRMTHEGETALTTVKNKKMTSLWNV